MNKNLRSLRYLSALYLLGAMISPSILRATNYTYTGTTSGNNWTNTAVFSPTGTPGSSDSLSMNGTGTGSISINGGNRTIVNLDNVSATAAQLLFGGTTGGSTLTVTGILSKNNSGSQTFTIRSSTTGALSLAINQLDYTGAGQFNLGVAATSQQLAALSITTANINASGETLFLAMQSGVTGTIGTLNMTAGSVSIRNEAGSNTLQVNNLTGSGGTIRGAFSSTGTSSVNTLLINASTNNTYSGALADFGTGTPAGTTLSVTKQGNGTQILGGTNINTGATTINAGTLQFAKTSALYNSTTASWTAAKIIVASGATLALNVGGTGEFTTANVTTLLTNLSGANGTSTTGFASGATLALDTTGNSSFTQSGVIADSTGSGGGALNLTKLGANTLAVTQVLNTYTGVTTINGGVLAATRLASGGTASSIGAATSAASNLVINGGTLSYVGGGASIDRLFTLGVNGGGLDSSSPGLAAINFTNTGAIALAGSNTPRTLTLSGTATGASLASVLGDNGSGATSVVKSGTVRWIMSGNNTYTGVTTISAGTLSVGTIGNGGVAGNLGQATNAAANIVFDGGALQYTGANATSDRAFTINSGKTATIDTANNISFAGATGSATTGALTKIGAGTLTLTGSNTYTGATTITTGTLQVDGSTDSGSQVDVGTAGTLAGTGTVNGNATLTGSGVINKSSGTIAGTLAVTGGSWNGSGAVTGAVTASSGTFNIGNGANLTANGDLNVTGGSIAAGNSASTITGSVNYTSSSSSTFQGVIAGSSKTLTMNNSASTLSLSGANTYTGATTISAGKLVVNGSLASGSAVSIGASGTLGGSGTIGGTVAVTGTISPGNSPGLLSTGSQTWNGGGNYNWQVVDANGVAGTGFDSLSITGGLDLTALNSGSMFNLNLWSLSSTGPDVNGDATNFTNTNNYTWKLASTTTGITGFVASYFNINVSANNNTTGFTNALGGGVFSVAVAGNDLNLVFTAASIPEPSTYAAFFGAVALFGTFIYRRRRSN